jgi:hypothetical protein
MHNINNGGSGNGRPAKNRFSITDSPAFRKANHDAMSAVKTSVAKLMAEWERFFREEGKARRKVEIRKASPVHGKNISVGGGEDVR